MTGLMSVPQSSFRLHQYFTPATDCIISFSSGVDARSSVGSDSGHVTKQDPLLRVRSKDALVLHRQALAQLLCMEAATLRPVPFTLLTAHVAGAHLCKSADPPLCLL
jgi:hypothetical protein